MHGAGTAFVINTCMMNYLLPMARNVITGQTVKAQDLTGARFTKQQQKSCQEAADRLATRMTDSTGSVWQGFCQAYTPTVRKT